MRHPADLGERRLALALRKARVRRLPTWHVRWRMSGGGEGPLSSREAGIFAKSPRSCSCFLCKRGEPFAHRRRLPAEDEVFPDVAVLAVAELGAEVTA